jgi:glutamyl-tRNA synthetase
LIEEEWARSGFRPDRTPEEILAVIALLQPRARSLKDFAGAFRGYFIDAYEYDTTAVAKFLNDDRTRALLVELGDRYQLLDEFTEPTTEQLLRSFAEEKGVKAGALINGSRVALTGQGVAPSLFAVMTALGKDRVVTRLRAAASIASPNRESESLGVVRE